MFIANKNIFIAIFLLMLVSLIVLYSISLSMNNNFSYFKRQIVWYIIGYAIMFIVAFLFDWHILKDKPLLVFSIFLISVLLLTAALLSPAVRGVKGWISLYAFSFQPAELTKLALIIVLAKYFSRRHVEIWRLRHIFISAVYFLIPAALLILAPDLGSVIILGLIWFFVILISGVKPKHFLSIMLVGAIVAVLGWAYILAPYQKVRISTFLFPNIDPLGAGYQIAQSKIAIGSGGLLGTGLGRGIETQYGFLPERHTDFIFASFAEEWGFVGIIALMILYSLLFFGLYRLGKEIKNNFSVFFMFGYVLMVLSQIFINISGNLGLLPITGISLPFLSYGGSNLLINFLGLGIIFSMWRRRAVFLEKITPR